MESEVYGVLLEFTDHHHADALAHLRSLLSRLFAGREQRLVVVDNATSGNVERELGLEINAICGDNSEREFSGWDKGIAWLESAYDLEPDSVVVVANDTFHRSYGAEYLSYFTPQRVASGLSAGSLIGYVDAYPRSVDLYGMTLQRWIRTSLFLARYETLCRLRPLALPFLTDDLFAKDWQLVFRDPSPLSENYRSYLKTWLFGEGPFVDGFGEAWHSQRPLGQATFEAAKAKIRTILCEHGLSARAVAAGIALCDVRADS